VSSSLSVRRNLARIRTLLKPLEEVLLLLLQIAYARRFAPVLQLPFNRSRVLYEGPYVTGHAIVYHDLVVILAYLDLLGVEGNVTTDEGPFA
jgi:hypothetical protein